MRLIQLLSFSFLLQGHMFSVQVTPLTTPPSPRPIRTVSLNPPDAPVARKNYTVCSTPTWQVFKRAAALSAVWQVARIRIANSVHLAPHLFAHGDAAQMARPRRVPRKRPSAPGCRPEPRGTNRTENSAAVREAGRGSVVCSDAPESTSDTEDSKADKA